MTTILRGAKLPNRILSDPIKPNSFSDRIRRDPTVGSVDLGIHVVHLHAEILLVNHLLKNKIKKTNYSKEVEIGISKMPCLICSYYIDAVNKKYDRCFCQCDSTNGKIHTTWTYRHNEDPSIFHLINEKLIEKI